MNVSFLKTQVSLGPVMAVTFAVGAGSAAAAYFITKHQFQTIIREEVGREIADTKRFYAKMAKRQEEELYATATEAAKALIPKEETVELDDSQDDIRNSVSEYVNRTLPYVSTGADSKDDPDMIEITHNVFTDADSASGEWDYDEELKTRTPDKPYIIEHDEFYQSDMISTTLTYFEGDGALADDSDEHIPDIEGTVGSENLARFGHGSRDNNILYIRNEKLDLLIEVVRNQGKYTEQVLGFLEHADDGYDYRRPRKFRHYDE